MTILQKFLFLLILPYSILFSIENYPKPFERSFIHYRYIQKFPETTEYNFSELPISPAVPITLIRQQSHESASEESNKFNIGAYPLLNTSSDNYSLRSILSININNFTIHNTMILNTILEDDTDYIGFDWRNFTGFAEEGYISFRDTYKSLGLVITYGRFYDLWGEARTDQLFLSSASRPLDQLKMKFRYKGFTFISKNAQLDKKSIFNRFFSAHRVTFKNNMFQIGFSESVVYGGENGSFEMTYLNPFLIFHGEKKNGPALDSNTMLAIDGRLFLKNKSIYFEFLIDDYQADADVIDDLEPNELGLILGADFSLEKVYLGIEFVGITNRTYKTNVNHEWYIHRNIPIGYGEGSDLWRANVFGRYYYSQDWQFDCEIDYLVKGEGEMSQPWDTPWNDDGITMESGYDEAFPTGILEKQFSTSIGAFRMFDHNKWISVEMKYISTKNSNHSPGIDEDNFEVSFGLSWLFTKEFNLE